MSGLNSDINRFLLDTKSLENCTADDFKNFPIEFFRYHINSLTLLNIWAKLPNHYKEDFNLQTKLPCFIHYNRSNWQTHFDGPPYRNHNAAYV